MKSGTHEKLLKIVAMIDTTGNASLTRLTVLKKWFEIPGRLSDFALWLARRSIICTAETCTDANALFDEALVLLGPPGDPVHIANQLNTLAAKDMHSRLKNFQNVFEHHHWGAVRMISNWNLMLVEHALEIYLWYPNSPTHGYKLAADYCQYFDCRFGNGLNGPSREKLKELVQFVLDIESSENKGKLDFRSRR
jgi:hypothetical protein